MNSGDFAGRYPTVTATSLNVVGARGFLGEGEKKTVAVIPFLPPSVNSLYNVIYSQRRVEKKPEVRAFCYRAKEYLRQFPIADDSLVRMDLVFAYPFNCKNGKLRRRDSQNMMKIISDLVAEKGGWDDSRIKSGSWESVDSENESVTVTLTEVKPCEY